MDPWHGQPGAVRSRGDPLVRRHGTRRDAAAALVVAHETPPDPSFPEAW